MCQGTVDALDQAVQRSRHTASTWANAGEALRDIAEGLVGVNLIPIHFERAVKPSFPRRACPRVVGGGNPLPGRTYGGITVTWYYSTGDEFGGQTWGLSSSIRPGGWRPMDGLVETGEGRTPRPANRPSEMYYRHSRHLVLASRRSLPAGIREGQPNVLGPGYRRRRNSTSNCVAQLASLEVRMTVNAPPI